MATEFLDKVKFVPIKISVIKLLAKNNQGNLLLLYSLLLAHRNSKTYDCFPAMSTLATESGKCLSTIKKEMKALEDLGLIQVHSGRRGYSNHYYFPYEEGYKDSVPVTGIHKRKGFYKGEYSDYDDYELADDEIDTPFGPMKIKKGWRRVSRDNGTLNPDEYYEDENGNRMSLKEYAAYMKSLSEPEPELESDEDSEPEFDPDSFEF